MSEHQQYHGMHPFLSIALSALSFICALLWAITIKDAQIAFGFVASAVAVISGIFVIRDKYFSTKKTKMEINYYDRKNKSKTH